MVKWLERLPSDPKPKNPGSNPDGGGKGQKLRKKAASIHQRYLALLRDAALRDSARNQSNSTDSRCLEDKETAGGHPEAMSRMWPDPPIVSGVKGQKHLLEGGSSSEDLLLRSPEFLSTYPPFTIHNSSPRTSVLQTWILSHEWTYIFDFLLIRHEATYRQ